MLRHALLLTALLASTGCPSAWGRTMVDIDLVDRDSGQWLSETPYRGDIWVPGIPGHRYAVRLTNQSAERVLVVLSVDGVNAVTGQTADPSQAGYVLEPWQSTEIAGWRKSMDDVAQFVFTDLPDSYAARTGRPQNVGVVGIAVYREARPVAYAPPPYIPSPSVPPYERAESRDQAAAKAASPRAQGNASAGAAAESAAPSAMPQQLGTGHGAREWSPVGQTQFVRASRSPTQVTQLRYDDENALLAMGVLRRPPAYGWREGPQAFPAGFVPDPPRY
ncbi:hypothetical protein LYSHEL_09380 [Lysobacter helvus]|uniref:Uncharacterized protein n=2 Tax=Lysobacteraceae TaxID=32033 RepID=A0ABN6FR90_9GAMM|nr:MULTISPECIES: hypothetical protein [Lysobacter]BCT91914.1 hypothetical protein LYSCAS_09380 [Lysobacter caseinilyticus]BCT95067.1 hypothetical protein LYSHEL_09380 [Lysobacter helvus]